MIDIYELIQRTQELKERIKKGQISLLEQDFRDLFLQLKQVITPEDLQESVLIMEDGTDILKKKIEEFEQFVSYLNKKDEIFNFIKNSSNDKDLAQIFFKSFQCPISLPQFSMKFLIESYLKLVDRKKVKTNTADIDHKSEYVKQETDFPDDFSEPFRDQMIHYYNTIRSQLPAKIDDLMDDSLDTNTYYEYFTFILHLIHRGYIRYKKEEGVLIDSGEVSE